MLLKIINYVSLVSLLLIFTIQTNAQKSITGIVTEEISTKDGKFLLHRTTHLPKGKTISGTVMVEPDSDKTKKRDKQIENLKKYILKVGDQIIGNDGVFTIKLPDIDNIPLQVFTSEGKLVQEIHFELSEPIIPENFKMPKTIRKDFPEKITGDFSGDISNANILLNEKPVDILAGNDTELFFKVEDIESGKQDLSLEYDDIKATESVHVVDYTLQVGKLNLNRGESTYLDIKIVGLEDLQEPLELEIINQSVGTVILEGGDKQTIEIQPSEVEDTGVWDKNFEIQSLANGSFSIFTNLNISKEKQQIQDCEIDGFPTLLPPEICEELNILFESLLSKTGYEEPKENTIRPEVKLDDIHIDSLSDKINATFVLQNALDIYGIAVKIIEIGNLKIVSDSVFEIHTNIVPITMKLPSTTGVYNLQMDVVYTENQSINFSHYFDNYFMEFRDDITLSYDSYYEDERDRITDEIERARDGINDRNRARRENNDEADNEDWESEENNEIARQLERIDFVLDNVNDIYSDKLKELIDSLIYYETHVPVPNIDALKQQIEDLKAALEACKNQLARLKKENEELLSEIKNIEDEHRAKWEELTALFDEAGYRYSGGQGVNSQGNLGWGFCGDERPMSEELKAAKNKIWDEMRQLSKSHKAKRAQQTNLAQQIPTAAAQCDQIAAELEAAQKVLESGNATIATVQIMNVNRDEICRQIKNILSRLEQWCEQNPELCGDMSEKIEEFVQNCPSNVTELREFWQQWNNVLSTKKDKEENLREEAERHAENAERIRRENEGIDNEIDGLEDRIRDLNNERNAALKSARERTAASARAAAERERQKQKEMENCIKKFQQWLAKNQEHLEDDNLDALQSVVDRLGTAGQVAGSVAESMATGASNTGAAMSGLASGVLSLGSALFYNWVQGHAESAVKNIADKHVLGIIQASLLTDNRKCGEIDPEGATSFFFFKRGNKVLVFRISATHGLEFLGEK